MNGDGQGMRRMGLRFAIKRRLIYIYGDCKALFNSPIELKGRQGEIR